MTWCEIVGVILGSNSEKNHNSQKMVQIMVGLQIGNIIRFKVSQVNSRDTNIVQTDEVRVFIASLDPKLGIKTQSEPLYTIFYGPDS